MEALEKMVSTTVFEQPEHTTGMDTAELGVLKANLANAAIQARAYVASRLEKLDIDRLAKGARLNYSGGTFVVANDILNPLLQPTGELLKKAGYNVRPLIGNSFESTYRLSALKGLGFKAESAARDLDGSIEAYGQALLQLEAAKLKEAKDDAKNAWNNL